MSFLAPFFFVGALLIAGPIVAHLIRRSTRDRIKFSSTRLLAPSPPRLRRRSQIENWWLLALRCLVVLALAAGFARPFFRQQIPVLPANTAPRHVVVVLDESASMQRAGLWPAALARVRTAAADLAAPDNFALLTVGGDTSVVLSGELWKRTPPPDRTALIESTLAACTPGWGPTRLDVAVDAALDELSAMAEGTEGLVNSRIVIVSDCTEGARVEGLAGRDWPPGCTVEIARVEGSEASDTSLQWLGWSTSPDGQRLARVRVVEQTGTSESLTLHLRAADSATDLAPAQLFKLAPKEARVVLVPVPPAIRGAARLELTGDAEPFNNQIWLVPPQPRAIALPYFGEHGANDPTHALFYVGRATAGSRDPVVRIAAGNEPATQDGERPLMIVAGRLNADQAAQVRARVTAGAFALVLLADASVVPTAATLVGETGWTTAPAPGVDSLLGQIDFQHPLFAPFADPRFSDFSRVHFWRPVPVVLPADSQATIVARFDDGSPAVTETIVGQGRVVTWGGDWTNVASQWVLSTKFVPWLQGLLERAAGGPPRPSVAEIGDAALLMSEANVRWRSAGAPANEYLPAGPTAPGIFQLEENGRSRTVALQVPVSESRNTPLPADTWEHLGVPVESAAATKVAKTTAPTKTVASDLVTESQQQFWRWLLIGTTLLLAVESIAAATAARRANLANPVTAVPA